MVKISVIVPVYNVEGYLLKCLTSIQKQTFTDFEAIIINDGSTDLSGTLAKRFCMRDPRFIYVEQENQGLGNTRNAGIQKAKGDFLSFIDSDDYVPDDMLETLYQTAIKEEADVVCGMLSLFFPNGTEKIHQKFQGSLTFSLSQTNWEEFYRNYFFSREYAHSAGAKLYRASLIKENNVHFGDNQRVFGEDSYFQLQLLLHVQRISFVNHVVYFYRQREHSIMQSYKPDLMMRQLTMAKDYEAMIHSNMSAAISSLLAFNAITMEAINIKQSQLTYRDLKRSLNQSRNDPFFNQKIVDIIYLRSYQLIPDMSRRWYTRLISGLEKKKLYQLSTLLIYSIYSLK